VWVVPSLKLLLQNWHGGAQKLEVPASGSSGLLGQVRMLGRRFIKRHEKRAAVGCCESCRCKCPEQTEP
jgi:hypothetical protein